MARLDAANAEVSAVSSKVDDAAAAQAAAFARLEVLIGIPILDPSDAELAALVASVTAVGVKADALKASADAEKP